MKCLLKKKALKKEDRNILRRVIRDEVTFKILHFGVFDQILNQNRTNRTNEASSQ